MYRIALIPGDGIGKEVVPAAARVLEETGLPLHFVELEAGWETFQRTGHALPEETVAGLKSCHGALFGAVSSPSHRVPGYSSPIVALRRILDLYANLRPLVSAPVPGSRPGVELLIVRENTECLYVKRERLEDNGDTAIAERVITRRASERIARMAFVLAGQRQRAKGGVPSIDSGRRLSLSKEAGKRALVTVVHKANVLSVTDGLFREAALAVAAEFPHIPVEEQLVDSMAYRMILEPERYDVVVAPNLYGDILSDAGAALVGGLGLIPSANVGDEFVLAEPVHGSAPDIAGQGIANPIATIRAAGLLLARWGESAAAQAIEQAVLSVLADGPRTRDLGGTAGTEEVAEEVIGRLEIEASR
ncbi:MAG: isocitrate/isopropylmalate dehydrogenase family protein [Caldilineaceae bacterium]